MTEINLEGESDKFVKQNTGEEKSQITTILLLWNALVGGSIIAVPYSFYGSGLIVGTIISFVSFLI